MRWQRPRKLRRQPASDCWPYTPARIQRPLEKVSDGRGLPICRRPRRRTAGRSRRDRHGTTGNQILMTQAVLAIVLSLGAVLGGWLAAQSNFGSWQRRVVAVVGASALIAALLVVQSKLAPIRGDIVAGNVNSILKSAGQGHIKVITVSPQLAKELFLALGRLIVSLGAIEGYILHDPVIPGRPAWQRGSWNEPALPFARCVTRRLYRTSPTRSTQPPSISARHRGPMKLGKYRQRAGCHEPISR